MAQQSVESPLVGLEYLEQVNQRIVNIDTAELERRVSEEPDLVIIDVRNESEINGRGGMIDGLRGWGAGRAARRQPRWWIGM